jgi:hypothetical protein
MTRSRRREHAVIDGDSDSSSSESNCDTELTHPGVDTEPTATTNQHVEPRPDDIESVEKLVLLDIPKGTKCKVTVDLDSFTVVARIRKVTFINRFCNNGTMHVSTKLMRRVVLKNHRISYQKGGIYKPSAYGNTIKPKTVNLSKLKQVQVATGSFGDIKFSFHLVCNDSNEVFPTSYMKDKQLMVIVGAMNMARLMKSHGPDSPCKLPEYLLEKCDSALRRDVQPFTADYGHQSHVQQNQTTHDLEGEVAQVLFTDFALWIHRFATWDPADIAAVTPPVIFGLPAGHEFSNGDFRMVQEESKHIWEDASFVMQAAGVKNQMTWHHLAKDEGSAVSAKSFDMDDLAGINDHMAFASQALLNHMIWENLGYVGDDITQGLGEFINVDIGTNFSLKEPGSVLYPEAKGSKAQTVDMMDERMPTDKGEFSATATSI